MLYSDINSNNAYDNPIVEDLDSIMQSVTNIMTCTKGEMPFLPEFGGKEESYIFEIVDVVGSLLMFQSIINNINAYEPRVTLNLAQSSVTPDYDNNSYNAVIAFQIKGMTGNFSVNRVI